MTDREPDDLYDALRDRLADYGQEPPAPLWANIRAQLPPPVAVPQRRRRRPVGRLALLLVLLSAVTWGGWQLAHRSKPAPTFVAAGAAGAPAPLVGRAARQRAVADQVATGAVVGWLTTAPAAASPADASAGRASGRAHLPATVVASVASGPATAAAVRPMAPTIAAVTKAGSAPIASSATRHLLAAVPHPERSGDKATRMRSATGRAGRGHVASPAAKAHWAAQAATRAAAAAVSPHAASTAPATVAARTTDGARNSHSHAAPNTEINDAASNRTHHRATDTTDLGTDLASQPVRFRPNPSGQGAATPAGLMTEPPISLREVSLVRPAGAVPTVSFSADTCSFSPPAVSRRWLLLAAAGPALTYRLLRSGLLYSALPAPGATTFDRSTSSTYSATQEQAAVGFGAAIQVRHQLTGRWGLSAGLGYQEYATSQTATVTTWQKAGYQSGVGLRPDSMVVSKSRLRDTYRFLTLPLRLSYQLGTGRARWRYGLLGGADVALYLGGTTSDGIIRKQWGSSGSPYRSFSLALSLGAEVRYRLAPRWELLAQPTATFFVNSLARPASGYAARYPLAASGLVGVAYGLR